MTETKEPNDIEVENITKFAKVTSKSDCKLLQHEALLGTPLTRLARDTSYCYVQDGSTNSPLPVTSKVISLRGAQKLEQSKARMSRLASIREPNCICNDVPASTSFGSPYPNMAGNFGFSNALDGINDSLSRYQHNPSTANNSDIQKFPSKVTARAKHVSIKRRKSLARSVSTDNLMIGSKMNVTNNASEAVNDQRKNCLKRPPAKFYDAASCNNGKIDCNFLQKSPIKSTAIFVENESEDLSTGNNDIVLTKPFPVSRDQIKQNNSSLTTQTESAESVISECEHYLKPVPTKRGLRKSLSTSSLKKQRSSARLLSREVKSGQATFGVIEEEIVGQSSYDIGQEKSNHIETVSHNISNNFESRVKAPTKIIKKLDTDSTLLGSKLSTPTKRSFRKSLSVSCFLKREKSHINLTSKLNSYPKDSKVIEQTRSKRSALFVKQNSPVSTYIATDITSDVTEAVISGKISQKESEIPNSLVSKLPQPPKKHLRKSASVSNIENRRRNITHSNMLTTNFESESDSKTSNTVEANNFCLFTLGPAHLKNHDVKETEEQSRKSITFSRNTELDTHSYNNSVKKSAGRIKLKTDLSSSSEQVASRKPNLVKHEIKDNIGLNRVKSIRQKKRKILTDFPIDEIFSKHVSTEKSKKQVLPELFRSSKGTCTESENEVKRKKRVNLKMDICTQKHEDSLKTGLLGDISTVTHLASSVVKNTSVSKDSPPPSLKSVEGTEGCSTNDFDDYCEAFRNSSATEAPIQSVSSPVSGYESSMEKSKWKIPENLRSTVFLKNCSANTNQNGVGVYEVNFRDFDNLNLLRKQMRKTVLNSPKSSVRSSKRKKIGFSDVHVFYFERSQGFTAVPSRGGVTLGMEEKHHAKKSFTLAQFEMESRNEQISRNRHKSIEDSYQILSSVAESSSPKRSILKNTITNSRLTDSSQTSLYSPVTVSNTDTGIEEVGDNTNRKMSKTSSDALAAIDDFSDDIGDSFLDAESGESADEDEEVLEDEEIDDREECFSSSDYFLQPVGGRNRKAMLEAAGVEVDKSEVPSCHFIRMSRQKCGCSCDGGVCLPDKCECAKDSIKCQVDRPAFPCPCKEDSCKNPEGRVEFSALRVRAHFLETMMRLKVMQHNGPSASEACSPQHIRFDDATHSATSYCFTPPPSIYFPENEITKQKKMDHSGNDELTSTSWEMTLQNTSHDVVSNNTERTVTPTLHCELSAEEQQTPLHPTRAVYPVTPTYSAYNCHEKNESSTCCISKS